MERLELRLDEHSHYAQLTICCQAIKYLYVHENSLRKCHGKQKVQGSMESKAMPRILCARPEVCCTKCAGKARCGRFQISTEYYVKYLTAIKVEHYTCKYLILALLSCAGR